MPLIYMFVVFAFTKCNTYFRLILSYLRSNCRYRLSGCCVFVAVLQVNLHRSYLTFSEKRSGNVS